MKKQELTIQVITVLEPVKRNQILHKFTVESSDLKKMQELYWRLVKEAEKPFNK